MQPRVVALWIALALVWGLVIGYSVGSQRARTTTVVEQTKAPCFYGAQC